MPQFIIQMFKTHPESNRPFSNTYRVTAADLVEAASGGDIISVFEQTMFDAATTIQYARVSTAAAGDDSYLTRVYGDSGSSGVTSQGEPLFNTFRVDVNVAGLGRPSRFHYRNVHEVEHTGREVDSTRRSEITALFNGLIADLGENGTPLVQEDGDVLSSANTYPFVTQRSLHRRRRKKVAP